MPKTSVILQSNYLPWKGYFDLIRRADIFIVLDCVQYTRSDWRNRNLIKTPAKLKWLTVPVTNRFRDRQPISAVEAAHDEWIEQHIRSIQYNYRSAAMFDKESPWLFELLREQGREKRLSAINVGLIRAIARRIGIATPIVYSHEIVSDDTLLALEQTDRLVRLCKEVGATRYLSGPAAKTYMRVDRFDAEQIAVEWMSYEGYPAYPQLWGAFTHGVSVVDLLLNVGSGRALEFCRSSNTP